MSRKSKPSPSHELPIKSSSNLKVKIKSSPSQLSQVAFEKKWTQDSRKDLSYSKYNKYGIYTAPLTPRSTVASPIQS